MASSDGPAGMMVIRLDTWTGPSWMGRYYDQNGTKFGTGNQWKRGRNRMRCLALILSAALASCDSRTPSKPESTPESTPTPDAEMITFMNRMTERDSALLAAKYHLPAQTVKAIIADYRLHYDLFTQAFASVSPTPSEETMQQTIDRLSATYKLPQDVVASLIMDDLCLNQSSRL